jgi:hypothetical protein
MLYFSADFPLDCFRLCFRRDSRLFKRASTATPLVEVQQFLGRFSNVAVGFHLALCLLPFGWGGKGFGDGFSFHLAGSAKVRALGGVVGLMAMSGRFATGTCDRSSARVGQFQHLLKDSAALLFQFGEKLCHGMISSLRIDQLS